MAGIAIGDVTNKLTNVKDNHVIPVSSGAREPQVLEIGKLKEYILSELADVAGSGSYDDLQNIPVSKVNESSLDSTITPGLYLVTSSSVSPTSGYVRKSIVLVKSIHRQQIGASVVTIITQTMINADGISNRSSNNRGTTWTEWEDVYSCKEDSNNKVTSLSEESTDDEYPSAKAVWDVIVAAFSEAGVVKRVFVDNVEQTVD